eukprot:s1346_g3.t1
MAAARSEPKGSDVWQQLLHIMLKILPSTNYRPHCACSSRSDTVERLVLDVVKHHVEPGRMTRSSVSNEEQ